MPPFPPLALIVLAISPVVTAVFVLFWWFRRDQRSQPSIVAAIPLILCPVAFLLAQGTIVLLATFQRIATGRSAGVKAVVNGLLQAQRPLAWSLLDTTVCLCIIVFFLMVLRQAQQEEQPLLHAYLALPALVATAILLAALFFMVYFEYSTVDLVMMIVDTPRNHELALQFGSFDPGFFAARISSRFITTTFLSLLLFCILILSGVLNLFWRQNKESRQTFALVLTLGSLAGCAVSALSEFGFVNYLTHVH